MVNKSTYWNLFKSRSDTVLKTETVYLYHCHWMKCPDDTSYSSNHTCFLSLPWTETMYYSRIIHHRRHPYYYYYYYCSRRMDFYFFILGLLLLESHCYIIFRSFNRRNVSIMEQKSRPLLQKVKS